MPGKPIPMPTPKPPKKDKKSEPVRMPMPRTKSSNKMKPVTMPSVTPEKIKQIELNRKKSALKKSLLGSRPKSGLDNTWM
jgi:hypothetical protein